MNTDELSRIGKVVKTFGTKGELVFGFETTFPEGLKRMESVFIRFSGNLVPFFIDEFESRGNQVAVVKLSDVNTVGDAALLIGGEIFITKDQLPEMDDSRTSLIEIIDFKVIDYSKGFIGNVSGILDLKDQYLLQVGSGKTEILIPFADSIINKIDRRSKSIFIDAPDGLIDLNRS